MFMGAWLRRENARDLQASRADAAVRKFEASSDINYPSWLYDEEYLEKFFAAQASAAFDADIPGPFLLKVLKNEIYRDKLFNIAGVMEESGYSFEEQSLAATEVLLSDWSTMRSLQD